jgi:tetratricopeptide (TPR) repeat protein
MIEEKLEALRALKKEATVLRNLGEFDGALSMLDEVIGELEKLQAEQDIDPADATKVRVEMADTWGMKGGVYRRFEDPLKNAEALAAYKQGRKIEQIDGKSTYNLTNTITLRITLGETSPTDSEMRDDLQIAIADLERKTEGARDDEWWAWSDLGQFYLLLDEFSKARRCYERAHNTGPTKGEYKRHTFILKELASATEKEAPEVAKKIEAVIEKLTQYMG